MVREAAKKFFIFIGQKAPLPASLVAKKNPDFFFELKKKLFFYVTKPLPFLRLP